MRPVRVGVLGVGLMGERHARVTSSLADARLAGVFDPREARCHEVAVRYGAPAHGSIEALLDAADAVVVATPTPLHFRHVQACLLAGKHVLVEKAITEHVEQAEELAALAERLGLLLQVGHIERYNPAYTELRRVLAEAGEPIALSFRRLSSFAASNQAVDVVLDLMIHDLDLAFDLFPSLQGGVLSAVGRVVRSSEIDHAVAQLSGRGAPLCTFVASRVTEHKVRHIEVTTPSAFIEADLLHKEIRLYRGATGGPADGQTAPLHWRVERIPVPTAEPLALELTDFVARIHAGSTPGVSAHDAVRAMRAVRAVVTQVQRGLLEPEPEPEIAPKIVPEPPLVQALGA